MLIENRVAREELGGAGEKVEKERPRLANVTEADARVQVRGRVLLAHAQTHRSVTLHT
jgi:hypothetical protein